MGQNQRIKKSNKDILDDLSKNLLDPEAKELVNNVKWWKIENITNNETYDFPVVVIGKGKPLLMLHGFDSSFLEFRRLVPFLKNHHKIIIPDLYGFGFCPRPDNVEYGKESIVNHINNVISQLHCDSNIGVIGASMGGALAFEIARNNPQDINQILLLAPAGLTGHPMPLIPPLNQIGVCFLSLPNVRKSLCRQAFAYPELSVGPAEEQIASAHLQVPGWRESLASFARKGDVANCGLPLPIQPFNVIWGKEDRILKGTQKTKAKELLKIKQYEIEKCGHLPHLDQPKIVAEIWLKSSESNEKTSL